MAGVVVGIFLGHECKVYYFFQDTVFIYPL